MNVSDKIKAINNKIMQKKAIYDLVWQTTKISALTSENVSKYEFFTGKEVLAEKDLLKNATTMKRFEYLPLGKELKAQIDNAKKQYQKLDDTCEFNKTIKKEKPTLQNYSKSDLIYHSNYRFFKYYRDIKKFDNLSLKSKYSFLEEFSNDLNKFNKLKTLKERTEKTNVYNTASELYSDLLGIYIDEYYELSDAKRNKMKDKYGPEKLFLETSNYNLWFENEFRRDRV